LSQDLAAMPATAFEIVNVNTLKLTVVNESQVVNLKKGTPITVTSSVYPGQEFNGKIIFIAAKADSSLNFPVEIEISNNVNNDLKAGMYGTVFKSDQQKQTMTVIPRNAWVVWWQSSICG
jgi:multidrug efflux pump subunit AcrA (membrane-fusion protein)